MIRLNSKALVGLALVGLALSGCGFFSSAPVTTKEVSEKTITDELAPQLDLGSVTPKCPEILDPRSTDLFSCTATTSDEQVITVEGEITPGGAVSLRTTNVIQADALPLFVEKAVADVNGVAGSGLVPKDLDCGDKTVVLDSNAQMVCGVNNNGKVHDVTFTVADIEQRQFDLVIADQPRA